MTLGYFAPLPPARTGVADYAAALLGELRSQADVRVNAHGDIDLYHIGNNELHRGIYRLAVERPGIVILHDAVLHHFLLGTLDETAYVEEFVYNYGEWNRQLALDLWNNRARSAADPRYFDYPMLKRIAAGAYAVVVHNPAAAAMVLRHAPQAAVVEIPHLFEAPALPPTYDVIRLRERLGLLPQTFLFGVFGHLRESKRLWSVLHALRKTETCTLLVAGQFASRDLERAIAPFLESPRILRTGYLSERDFWLHACAVDACINLRYPAAGESSGIAIRLMGIGKPVILSAAEETSRFPDDACLRIDTGPAEIEMLAAMMNWLVNHSAQAHEIGRRASAHIQQHHALGTVAAEVLETAVRFAGRGSRER